jgi:hypothetical protein
VENYTGAKNSPAALNGVKKKLAKRWKNNR